MEGQRKKARPRKVAGEKRVGTGAKKRTKGASKRTRMSASASGVGKRKAAGRDAARGSAKKGVRKAGSFRGSKKPSAETSLSAPSVERVREEARALEERGPGKVESELQYTLPDSYGRDRVVAMSRDPYWIHAYWEITEETLSRALESLGSAQLNVRRVLRVYVKEGEGAGAERVLFDVFLTPGARNWYINVGGPGRTYRVDVGLLTARGKFVCLASSNIVRTPSDRMSDVLDEKWMSLPSEYEEMYALSGGLTRGVSSPELHERLARELEVKLASPLFSPGIREVRGEKGLAKSFWFIVDTDLVVYGATVPGSTLKINGGDWRLREDGTFSFRCHLPDGAKEISVSAHSSDGARNEQAKLKVSRGTRQTRS